MAIINAIFELFQEFGDSIAGKCGERPIRNLTKSPFSYGCKKKLVHFQTRLLCYKPFSLPMFRLFRSRDGHGSIF